MMDPISFRAIASTDLPELRTWFGDAQLARRISFPSDEWFTYVTAGNVAECWVAVEADQVIAELQVDQEGQALGYLDIAIRPDLRGRGLGAAVLSAFLVGPGRAYPILEGRIEPDNAASLACCQRCGFALLPEPDADGLIRAVFRYSMDRREVHQEKVVNTSIVA